MIRQLLESISFENIAITLVSYQGPLGLQSPDRKPATSGFRTIRDLDILRALVPKQDLKTILKTKLGQHLLSFALRHQISKLQICSIHTERGMPECLAGLIDETDRLVYRDCFSKYHNSGAAPTFSFNISGIIVGQRKGGCCLAFDAYDQRHCQHQADLFCDHHQSERWWLRDSQLEVNSSKMYQFYLNLENAGDYQEEDLETLVDCYWKRFSEWQLSSHDISIQDALDCLDIVDTSALSRMTASELRSCYHRKSLAAHPDHGGAVEDFLRLKASFKRLQGMTSAV